LFERCNWQSALLHRLIGAEGEWRESETWVSIYVVVRPGQFFQTMYFIVRGGGGAVGNGVGVIVGITVGVGAAVGALVGAPVGEAVGTLVGATVGAHMSPRFIQD
jgi:hypothetical protein